VYKCIPDRIYNECLLGGISFDNDKGRSGTSVLNGCCVNGSTEGESDADDDFDIEYDSNDDNEFLGESSGIHNDRRRGVESFILHVSEQYIGDDEYSI
jgi:hypothetical protein